MKYLPILFALCASSAFASPFLVCDPFPAGLDAAHNPVSFILKGIATAPVSVPATVNADGTVQLHYDIATIPNGSYTVIADAVNVYGGVSPDSGPFTFTSGVPATPTNLRLVP